eukprot:scaffold294_cov221-Amphora_coffeaeformis.AAC.31
MPGRPNATAGRGSPRGSPPFSGDDRKNNKNEEAGSHHSFNVESDIVKAAVQNKHHRYHNGGTGDEYDLEIPRRGQFKQKPESASEDESSGYGTDEQDEQDEDDSAKKSSSKGVPPITPRARTTCLVVAMPVIVIAFSLSAGGLAVAIFLFDIDLPYTTDGNEASSKDVSISPTTSPPSSNLGPTSTSTISQTQWQMLGSVLTGENATHALGTSLALATGTAVPILIVGAPGVDEVLVYEIGNNEWQTVSLIRVDDVGGGKHWGESVAISTDGGRVAASHETAAKVFQRPDSTVDDGHNNWTQVGQDIPRKGRGKCPVALSADGKTVALGSKWYWPAGIVQVYKYNDGDGNWTLQVTGNWPTKRCQSLRWEVDGVKVWHCPTMA